MAKDLRARLKQLEAVEKLKRITVEVDKDWEIACIARYVSRISPKDRYGLMFEKIKGFDIPLVVGVTGGSREIYAIALDVPLEEVHERWIQALSHPVPPKQVKTGPCKENIFIGDKVDLLKFSAPIWTPGKDPGPLSHCRVYHYKGLEYRCPQYRSLSSSSHYQKSVGGS